MPPLTSGDDRCTHFDWVLNIVFKPRPTLRLTLHVSQCHGAVALSQSSRHIILPRHEPEHGSVPRVLGEILSFILGLPVVPGLPPFLAKP